MAHARRLDNARALIRSMSMGPMDTAWRSLLNTCQIHGDLDLTKRALEELRHLGTTNTSDYIIIMDMHAKAKNWATTAAFQTEADASLGWSLHTPPRCR